MSKIFCMDNNYNTTRLCYKLLNNKFLDDNGNIKKEFELKINFLSLNLGLLSILIISAFPYLQKQYLRISIIKSLQIK